MKPSFAIACLAGLLSGCSDELPPRSVEFFMRESASLQATLLRCREAGFEAEDDVECANARQAAERLGEQEAETKRVEREAAFERKREALRRRQIETQREAVWPEEEEVEPPLGDDFEPPIGEPPISEFPPGEAPPGTGTEPLSGDALSDETIETEIRRLQEELERRSRNDLPAEVEARDSAGTEPAPPPE